MFYNCTKSLLYIYIYFSNTNILHILPQWPPTIVFQSAWESPPSPPIPIRLPTSSSPVLRIWSDFNYCISLRVQTFRKFEGVVAICNYHHTSRMSFFLFAQIYLIVFWPCQLKYLCEIYVNVTFIVFKIISQHAINNYKNQFSVWFCNF